MWLPAVLAFALALSVGALVPFRWELLQRLPEVGPRLAEDGRLLVLAQVVAGLLGLFLAVQTVWLVGRAVDYLLETPALAGRLEAGPFGRWLRELQRGQRMGSVLLLASALSIAALVLNVVLGRVDGAQIVLVAAVLVAAAYTRRPFSFAYDVLPGLLRAPVELARWTRGYATMPTRRPLAPPRPRQERPQPSIFEADLRSTVGDDGDAADEEPPSPFDMPDELEEEAEEPLPPGDEDGDASLQEEPGDEPNS